MAYGDPGTFSGTDIGLQPGEQLHTYGVPPGMNKSQAQAQVDHEKNLAFQRGRPVFPDDQVTQAEPEIPPEYTKAGASPPAKLNRFVRFSLAILLLGAVFVGIWASLPTSFYRQTVYPYLARNALESRVDALGGFSTTAEWPALRTNKAPEAAQWALFAENPERRFQARLYQNREARVSAARLERWLSRECTRGLASACVDRAVALRVGYLPYPDGPPGDLLPNTGPSASNPRVMALKARLATSCWSCEAWSALADGVPLRIRDRPLSR